MANNENKKVFIAGIGSISAAGVNTDCGFEAIRNGKDNIKPLTLFESGLKTPALCGQITEDVNAIFPSRYRTLSLALIAATEAMAVLPDYKDLKLGVISATTVGGISVTERFYEQLKKDPSYKVNSRQLAVHEPTVLSSELCRHFNATGFHTISTACSTGLHALGIAKRFIENDIYDICLAVGSDALSLLTVRGFASLTLLDSSGCKPFDKRRAGISLGEGAGAMLLVSEKVFDRCKSDVPVILSGWGASADCFHMTAPHPEGKGAKRAMLSAINEAAIGLNEIDLTITHGTATPDNDKAEIKAMQSIFPKLPAFCSMKRTLGHTLAASGLIEAVFAVKCLQHNIVPPTAGFEILDDEIGVAPANYSKQPIRHILKNSFGFGGNNAVAVFSKLE